MATNKFVMSEDVFEDICGVLGIEHSNLHSLSVHLSAGSPVEIDITYLLVDKEE